MTALVISASVVLYKPELATLSRTLLALQEAGRLAKQCNSLELSLTLVDNSSDSQVHREIASKLEAFRVAMPDWRLQLLLSPANIGYGRGNNLVIAATCSDYHIVVNPDLFVHPDCLLEAVRFMQDHADVGLLSPAVFGEDGARHFLCKRNPTLLVMFLRSFAPAWLQSRMNAVIDKFEMRDCDYEKQISPVEYPTGCFMFFRTAPLQAIGGFDPDFFLHYEDADIGRRLWQVARVVYYPGVRVVHQWARDTHRSLRSKLLTARSGWLYWRKWGGIFRSQAVPDIRNGGAGGAGGPSESDGGGRRVLVTGANGFIGRAVCAELPRRGYRVLGVRRKGSEGMSTAVPGELVMEDVDERTDWSSALSGVDSVVHLAARVHLMRETAADPLAEFRRVNVALTVNLARQAVAAGVKRFVFISSIKVNGEISPIGQPFAPDDVPRPSDPYGISKLEAEHELMQLAKRTGLEVVIVRPVLVYGPGVKANFHAMMHWVLKGLPLPLGALDSQRSFLALDNLVDFIAVCLQHPAAANETFLASDGEDLTVTALLKRTAAALNKPARLLPVPMLLMKMMGRIAGREAVIQRLCDTLQVDISKNYRLLGWSPPISVDAALHRTAKHVLEN